MPLQIRRGTAAERDSLSAPLVIGELLYTTDTGRLYIGDGTALGGPDIQGNTGQGGKGLSITGFTSEDAQDATSTLFSNGTHSGIFFTYDDSANSLSAAIDLTNYTGNVAIDGAFSITGNLQVGGGLQAASFKGSIFADDSTLLVDAVSGSIPYSVISGTPTAVSSFTNDAGYITAAQIAGGTITIDVNNTGDLQGNVFGDDSTLLVDAINSIIPASVVVGTFTGNVVGNVAGDLVGNVTGGDITGDNISGNIITNLISSEDSGAIIFDSPAVFETTLRVQSQLVVEDEGLFLSTDPRQFPLSISASHDDDQPSNLTIRRSRGTLVSPTALNLYDRIGQLNFTGYDGSDYIFSAGIQGQVSSTPSSGVLPSSLRFFITSPIGTFYEAATLNQNGAWITYGESASDAPLQSLTFHNSSSDASNVHLYRARGTRDAPTALQSTDPIFDIRMRGYDGSSYTGGVTLRASVNGTVSTGIVPAKLEIALTNSSGTPGIYWTLEETKATFAVMPVLPSYANETAADTAIGGAGNRVDGMMYYDSGASKIKAVAGGVYVALH